MDQATARLADVSPESSVVQRIVDTARHHFFAHGFRGVTMDDLAAELGMSKKTLYAHFPSKTMLVEAVLLRKIRDMEAELERITFESSADFTGALQQLLATLHRHMGEIQPPFLRDIRREAPELFQMVESRRPAIIQRYFGKLLADGRSAGMIRKDIPVKLAVEILVGAVQAIVNPKKLEELEFTPNTAASAIITVVLEGMVTAKGRIHK
jgi:AcrR family transcriptional regulator